MLSIKTLKPFYVKQETRNIRIMLAYQYFTIHIDGDVYQFVPVEGREIVVNRKTKRIENEKDILVFQKGKHMIQISIAELLDIPEFLTHVHSIAHRYLTKQLPVTLEKSGDVIYELERQNAMRLIDQAIDQNDKEAFLELCDYMNENFNVSHEAQK